MPEPVLVADAVSFDVDGATLVDGVDLRGVPGEVVALCGPNGAGKTTMMRLLAGDLVPRSGQVRVGTLDTATAVPTDLARVRSVMRQGSRSDIPFTVATVVEMGRHPHRSDPDASRERDEHAIASAMARTDTLHLAGRVFATLSGGEQTRVVIARILAQAAPVVLLDEPTTTLDVAHQERVLSEIRRIADDGNCVVVVLHDLNAAAYYADRVVLMADAAVHAEGAPADVLRSELLSAVYGQDMVVTAHPTRDCPLVLVR